MTKTKIKDKLYIGDVTELRKTEENQIDIDVILNLSSYKSNRQQATDYTWIDLYIRDSKHSQHSFNTAVQIAVQQIKSNKKVLINCAAGISRSTTVTATALAEIEDKSFQEALEQVKEHRETANPAPGLREHAKNYLASKSVSL